MSALKFKIERPEDRRRKKEYIRIGSYCATGVAILIILLGLWWYIALDRLPPEITLNSPADNFGTSNSLVDFDYTVEDDSSVNCEILLNDVVVDGQGTLKEGKNIWKVHCVDEGYYAKESTSEERTVYLITPFKPTKISLVEAAELDEGILQIYENTGKSNLGKLLFEILPNNAGLVHYEEASGKPLAVTLWGKSSLGKQEIKINNLTVNLPELHNLTGQFALYIDSAGNTYHSRKDHTYLNDTVINLEWSEALVSEHKANQE